MQAGVAAAEEDVEEEEEDDEEESIMFERECEILEKFKDGQDGQEDQIKRLGQVEIRIIYDDDVYGARIIANKQVGAFINVYNNSPYFFFLVKIAFVIDSVDTYSFPPLRLVAKICEALAPTSTHSFSVTEIY